MKNSMEQKNQYNDFAQEYADSFLNYNTNSIEAYFKYLNLDLRGKAVLDVGCGDGYDLANLQQKGALIFGIDASEEMVKLAQQQNSEGTIRVGAAEDIPFPNQSFDVVVSKWVFQATPAIDPIYKEVARVLKPGGTLIFLTTHPIRQFLEKKQHPRDYFKKEQVTLVFFEGQISEVGTSHTFNEYFSPIFFSNFTLEAYEEGWDSGAAKVNGDTYPSYFIIQARLKN